MVDILVLDMPATRSIGGAGELVSDEASAVTVGEQQEERESQVMRSFLCKLAHS